ncbi:MAG: SDR family oxidoreductase [Acidobacteriia bacterium]|nr:SDR family oxidoreductase [Terriglobia bacterium]
MIRAPSGAVIGLPGGFRAVKINVLGATGGLGSRVVDALLDRGVSPEDLIACSRSPDKIRRYEHLGIDIRQADYDVPGTLAGALEGTDVLMLIPSATDVEPRIVQHSNILDAARSEGVKRVVLTSSSAARTDSEFLIAPYLVYAESRLRTSGLGWTILRNGIYLDPLVEWAPALAAMGRLPYPVSRGRIAYVSRDDLARACAAACALDQHAGQVYELTGPRALSMPDLASALTYATGKTIVFDEVTEEQFAEICRADHVPEPDIAILTSLYRAADHGEFEHVSDDIRLLTGSPPTAAQDYLGESLRTYRASGRK